MDSVYNMPIRNLLKRNCLKDTKYDEFASTCARLVFAPKQ